MNFRKWFGLKVNWVERRYDYGVRHYGEADPGRQFRLKRRILKLRELRAQLALHRKKTAEFARPDKPRIRYKLQLRWLRSTDSHGKRCNIPYYQ